MKATLNLNRDQYLELEKVGLKAFHPLTGFMTEKEFNSVVNELRLPSGEVFSLPVVLDIDEVTANQFKSVSEIELFYEQTFVGRLFPEDFYRPDRSKAAKLIFKTESNSHPGVSYFYSLKSVFVGGRIELIKRVSLDISNYELTPDQTKCLFNERGWRKIVGFQTRNVPHRAHEYLQRVALEHADGLFVQPLVGRKRTGDYTPDAVITGYKKLINSFLPQERVLFGILSTVMRYAGPREALFHAIVRRNYGCTHFIIGRDHAGVGNWYGKYEAHELAQKFEKDLGIEIMLLKGPFYCKTCDGIATENTCSHSSGEIQQISGSYMRSVLSEGRKPDGHLMRSEIVEALCDVQLFID